MTAVRINNIPALLESVRMYRLNSYHQLGFNMPNKDLASLDLLSDEDKNLSREDALNVVENWALIHM